jgi:hypothetical protein
VKAYRGTCRLGGGLARFLMSVKAQPKWAEDIGSRGGAVTFSHYWLCVVIASGVLWGCGEPIVAARPDPLPQTLRPVGAVQAGDGVEKAVEVSHVRAQEGERIELLLVSEALEVVYANPEAVLEKSAQLAAAVALTREQNIVPEDGRVALLAGWIGWPYFDLRPPQHWLTLPQRMSTVESFAAQSSDSEGAQSWRRRDQARLAAVQVATAYFELWLDFAAYGVEGEALTKSQHAWQMHCADANTPQTRGSGEPLAPQRSPEAEPLVGGEGATPPALKTTKNLTDCALSAFLISEQAQRVRRMRGRWVLRSDVLGSLLGYEPSILLVPPRHIAPQARVRVDDRAALMQASLEAHPAYRAIKADESEALGELIAAWWAMTGIIFGGIENPVLGNSTALMGGFTVILEWDYYWAAWLALQGARGDYAVKELQSEMHAEEVGSAMDDALARLEASLNSARDALQMQEDAHAAASAALACTVCDRAPPAHRRVIGPATCDRKTGRGHRRGPPL